MPAPNQHYDADLSRLSAALIEAAEAIEVLDATIDVAESRPESPTDAQMVTLLGMIHTGMCMTRDRLQGLRMVGGTALGDLIEGAIDERRLAHE